jgi:hypothetical protein
MIKTFYMVWNESHGNPTYKHETYTSAEVEAKRLAKQSPGEKFHVLASCCTYEVPEPVIKTVHETEPEDIPF